MFYTYILENLSGVLYIGQTGNLDTRLDWHNSGKSIYTKNKGPWKIIFSIKFNTRSEAIKCEKYLKSLKSPKYIREYIIGK